MTTGHQATYDLIEAEKLWNAISTIVEKQSSK